MPDILTRITPDEAMEALEGAAVDGWIHCIHGAHSEDVWLGHAVDLAETADHVAWLTRGLTLGHDLVVEKDGRVYRFAVKKPWEVT